MRLNFEKRVLFHVLFFCAIITVIGGAVIWPTVVYIRNLNRDSYELRVYMEKRYESTKNMRFSRQKTEEIKEEVQSFSKLIFRATDQLDLITSLENIAGRHNITQKIANLNLDEKTKLLNISLTTSGSYDDSWRYLADIEKINYFLQIDKLTFSPIFERTEQSSSTKMLIDLKLYVNE
jgi:Tfp pilus assembly protein PilO